MKRRRYTGVTMVRSLRPRGACRRSLMLRVGRTSREARSTAFQNVTFRIHRRRGSDQSLVNRVTLGTRRVGAYATSRSLQARMREPTTIPRPNLSGRLPPHDARAAGAGLSGTALRGWPGSGARPDHRSAALLEPSSKPRIDTPARNGRPDHPRPEPKGSRAA